jgi:hypothetical protein
MTAQNEALISSTNWSALREYVVAEDDIALTYRIDKNGNGYYTYYPRAYSLDYVENHIYDMNKLIRYANVLNLIHFTLQNFPLT